MGIGTSGSIDADGAAGDGDGSGDDDAGEGDGDGSDPTPPEEPQAPETDDDVEKPGKYKAEFVDADGKKFYASDISQLPEDFEPRSQREFAMAMQDLGDKRDQFRADNATYQADKAKFDQQGEITSLRKSWDDDIEKLTKDKTLPEDATARKKVVDGVYKLMQERHDAGKTISSWKDAHEIYAAQEANKAAKAAREAEDENKSKRGGKVMGGGGSAGGTGAGGDTRPLVREGVPRGVGLDKIHQATIAKMK